MKVVSLKIYHISKWVLLIFLICIAFLSVAGRTLLSNVDYFKNAIEQELADYGIKGVSLENIEGHWEGLQPLLKIQGASLSIPGRSHALSVNELSLRVKLIPSLLSRDLILESFHSSIQKLILVRDKKGAWWLNDIRLTAENNGDANLDIYAFFQRLPSFVNIDVGLIQLRDLRHGVDYLIQNSTLRSSRKKQKLSLNFLMHLPSSLGRSMQFFLTGDASNQKLFVEADRLDLARIFQLTTIQKIPLKKAIISLQSWVDLEKFNLKKISTKAIITQLIFNNQKNKQQAFNFSLRQKATVDATHWRLDTRVNKIQKGQQKFADLDSQILISKQGAKPQLWIDRLKLSFLQSIVKDVVNDDSIIELLEGVKPNASIDNIVAELDVINPMQSVFSFNFKDFKSSLYHSIPAINGIDGSVISIDGKSQLNIDAQQVALDFGDLFRAPINLDRLKFKSIIQIKDSTILVDSDHFSAANADASLEGRLRIEAGAEQRPFASIRVNFKNGKVKAVPRYLPVKIMHENVVSWLDKSLLAGRVTSGDFLFHGRLENPAMFNKKQSGIMMASVNVSDPEIDYLADWPVVGQGEGRLEFVNTGMSSDFTNVKYAFINVDKVNLKIPDFLTANLFINATTKTDAQNLLASLSSLPILNVFDQVKQKTKKISGEISSSFNLDIPLSNQLKKQLSVRANADLKGVSISIPEWMIEFKSLKGAVDIENEKITATALSGEFYGDKVQLSVKPQIKRNRTLFQLSGDVHTQNFLKLTPDFLQQPVSGISPWNVSVSVAHQPTPESALLEIKANSSLLGTELRYPQPSKVLKQEQRPIKFNAKLFDHGDFLFDLSLAENLKVSGLLNLAEDADDNLTWLNVSLGETRSLTEKSGVTILGKAGQIDLNDWFDYQKHYFPEDENDKSPPFLKRVSSVNLVVDKLILADQQALNSKIRITNDGKQLLGNIDSTLTKGSFQLPYKMDVVQPFMAELEYIKLKKSETEDETKIDINDMPNLFVKSKVVSYEKMDFSELILSTRSEPNNFVVEQLDFSRDKVKLKSSGSWQFQPDSEGHVSVFNIDIKGKDFGKTVNNLGLGETIQGSKVKFNGQIGWGGELYSINWPTLIGEVDLQLEDGYLLNVDPGAGRFVGLLSFSALPKRLFLDFGDVVKEGMQFDKIKGKFSIHGEILETDDASMDSVSAEVKIKGQTNLRHQTYDQTMIIIPKIGDTLPILGTLAAGSTVGWGLLLLQKIFKKPIDKSVGIEYKVTGSWENPEVNLVKKPKIKQENDGFNVEDF